MNFTNEEINEFKEQIANFVIPDPNDELIPMYEMEKIKNLLNIRAEKYDSPEHQEELIKLKKEHIGANKGNSTNHKEFKVARNKQNPNYTNLFNFLNQIRKLSSANYTDLHGELTGGSTNNLSENDKDEYEKILVTLNDSNIENGQQLLQLINKFGNKSILEKLEEIRNKQSQLLNEFLEFITSINNLINGMPNGMPNDYKNSFIPGRMNWIPDVRVIDNINTYLYYICNTYLFFIII